MVTFFRDIINLVALFWFFQSIQCLNFYRGTILTQQRWYCIRMLINTYVKWAICLSIANNCHFPEIPTNFTTQPSYCSRMANTATQSPGLALKNLMQIHTSAVYKHLRFHGKFVCVISFCNSGGPNEDCSMKKRVKTKVQTSNIISENIC